MNLKTKNLLLTALALPMSLVANAAADWQSNGVWSLNLLTTRLHNLVATLLKFFRQRD